MGPIACLGVLPAELNEQVSGAVWACVGRDADAPLGALIRLAAEDGGGDLLAAIAVAHQLEGGATPG